MGFTINYRSTRPVSSAEVEAINQTAEDACHGRTWLSCEPPVAFHEDDEGRLLGHSKPNFQPHPDDVAAADREGLPDGTARDLLDVLCRLSREHEFDWEISHDYSDGPIGFIRGGECDSEVLSQIEAFADLAAELSSLIEMEIEMDIDAESDDDPGPSILPFQPKQD
jgi:hypothetical protein